MHEYHHDETCNIERHNIEWNFVFTSSSEDSESSGDRLSSESLDEELSLSPLAATLSWYMRYNYIYHHEVQRIDHCSY